MVAAKLDTVGEYVYLWNKLLYPVVLDSFYESVGEGPLVVLLLRSNCFVSISKVSKFN